MWRIVLAAAIGLAPTMAAGKQEKGRLLLVSFTCRERNDGVHEAFYKQIGRGIAARSRVSYAKGAPYALQYKVTRQPGGRETTVELRPDQRADERDALLFQSMAREAEQIESRACHGDTPSRRALYEEIERNRKMTE